MNERLNALHDAVAACRKRAQMHAKTGGFTSEYRPARQSEAELCALAIETLIRREEQRAAGLSGRPGL